MLAIFGDTKFVSKDNVKDKKDDVDIGDYLFFAKQTLQNLGYDRGDDIKFVTRSGVWLTEKVQVSPKSQKQYGLLVRQDQDEFVGFRTTFIIRRSSLSECNFRFIFQNSGIGTFSLLSLHLTGSGITNNGFASPNTLALCFGSKSLLVHKHFKLVNSISLYQNDRNYPIANDSYEKVFEGHDDVSETISVQIEYTHDGHDFCVYLNHRKPYLHTKIDLGKILDVDVNGDCYIGFMSVAPVNRGTNVDIGGWSWTTVTKKDKDKLNCVDLLKFPVIALVDYLHRIVEQKKKQAMTSQGKLDLFSAIIDETPTIYSIVNDFLYMKQACDSIPVHLHDFIASLQDPDEENSELNKSYTDPIIPYVDKILKPITLLKDKLEMSQTTKIKYQEWPILVHNFNEIKYNFKEIKKVFQEAVEKIPHKGTLKEDLEKGVNNKLFSDCIFEVENKTFVGHRILFQCRTPKFYESYIKNSSLDVPIVVQNVSSVLFLEFLYYVYSNKIPTDVTTQQSLETLIQSWEGDIVIGSYSLYTTQLKSLLECTDSKDVQFLVEDEIMPSHKIILSLRNEFFKALLTSGMAESQQSQIVLNDLQPSTIHVLLEYLYGGSTSSMSPNDAVLLLCTASHIIDSRLKHICENIIQNGIDVENVVSLFEAATFYSAIHLQMFSRNFIINNFSTILKTEDWKNLDSKLQEEIYVFLDPSAKAIFDQYKKISTLNNAPVDIPRRQRKKKESVENIKEEVKTKAVLNQCFICKKHSNLLCSKCHNAVYCSVEHQKQDWKQHKIKCQ